ALISKVTDAVMAQVTEWQNRPLDAVYPIPWRFRENFTRRHVRWGFVNG
ncbi:hypothetical protein DCV69_23945, partial [Salmonella enterica subsp. enterica serovar Infantis]|nr:hypothetical protein [Salmonella enterica subsp. enterica serovar Infantis]